MEILITFCISLGLALLAATATFFVAKIRDKQTNRQALGVAGIGAAVTFVCTFITLAVYVGSGS